MRFWLKVYLYFYLFIFFYSNAADKVVSKQTKFEELVVASQQIAAATAQLVIASRVKADRGSEKLAKVSDASKRVTEATGQVVATAKSCAEMVEESGEDSFCDNFTLMSSLNTWKI